MKKFTRIPNELIHNTALAPIERLVCMHILSKQDGWIFVPAIMAGELGFGVRTIRDALRNLRQKNIIKMEQTRGADGRFGAALIAFTDCTFTASGRTASGNAASGRTASGILPLNNTNISKTETSKTEKNKTERESAGRSKTHTQSSLSSSSATKGDPAEMEHWFVEQTKAAAEGIGCPREVLTKFYLHWTQPTADGVPLWKTKSAFDFKARLMTWIINER